MNGPYAITSDGTHVWIVNLTGDFVASPRRRHRRARPGCVGHRASGSTTPEAISSDGSDVWVANNNDSVTNLPPPPAHWSASCRAPSYGFSYPYAISSDGSHVWVAILDGNSVTELSATTGGLVQVISSSSYGIDYPYDVSDGTDVWVANYNGNSVTEFDACYRRARASALRGPATGSELSVRHRLQRHRRLGHE